MAFITIPSLLTQIGKPIIKRLWDLTKDNLDDHEARINIVEGAAGKIEIWNDRTLNASSASTLTNFDDWKAPFAFDLISAHVAIYAAGALTGTIEADIKKGTTNDYSLASTIFTTKPSIDVGVAADYTKSTNAVLDAGQSAVAEGEYLFLDFTSLPTGGILGSWRIFLVGEAS